MAAAAILTADKIATELIFKDNRALTVEEISEFLKSKNRVSLMQRAYNTLCDWIFIHSANFRGVNEESKTECYGIVEWGKDDGKNPPKAHIIRTAFDKFCSDNGINAQGFLSHLKSRRLIDTGKKGYTKLHYFGNYQRWPCVCLNLPNEEEEVVQNFEEIDEEDERLPF